MRMSSIQSLWICSTKTYTLMIERVLLALLVRVLKSSGYEPLPSYNQSGGTRNLAVSTEEAHTRPVLATSR
jgi:hypothetical protein